MRLLEKLNTPAGTALRAADEVAVRPALKPPSWSSGYSSLVPTTISGLPSPLMSATAGVSMIAPWSSGSPSSESGLNVGTCVAGSIELTFDESTTTAGKPLTPDPSACQAYTLRSIDAATI